MGLVKFKIEYNASTTQPAETVTAIRHDVDGDWIVFTDGGGAQILRVRAAQVHRILREVNQ